MWRLKKNISNIAMIDENGQTISYADIQKFTEQMRIICTQRDIVLCLCKNTLGSIIGYLSFIEIRIVPILLEDSIEKELINKICEDYTPYYIWAPQEMKFSEYSECYTAFEYRLWKQKDGKLHDLHPDLALLLSTSGTTGSSKMVRISYDNLYENTCSIIDYLKISELERPITVLPMCYAYGLSIINTHIMAGATIIVTTKSIIQKEFWDILSFYKVTSISGVPYTYQMLERMQFCKWNLPYLRTLTQAGGKLPEELQYLFAEYAASLNKKFVIMYGQCEATARISYLPSEHALTKIGSIGVAIPKGKLNIVNDQKQEIKGAGKAGEILYSGPNVMMGYAENIEDLIQGDVQGDFLLTGDIGYIDRDGFYYIIGRKKRIIKLFGKRVCLDEVENYLKEKYMINCACIEKKGKLLTYLTDINQKEIVQEILTKKFKLPAMVLDIQEIYEIPRSTSGKILYSQLQ